MFCTNCGKSIPNDVRFCAQCGAENKRRIRQSVPTPPQLYEQSVPQQSMYLYQPYTPVAATAIKKTYTGLKITLSCLAVVVAGAIIWGTVTILRAAKTELDSVVSAESCYPSASAINLTNSYTVDAGGDTQRLDALPTEDTVYTQTILIYMVGSNLESECGAATLDLEEMMAADFDPETVNILIYTGGAEEWEHSAVPDHENAIFKLENGSLTELARFSNQNMGEPDTLSDFITYGLQTYPAQQQSLILWDHGGGPMVGYGGDECYDYDTLTLPELRQALDSSIGQMHDTFSFVGFDACLMGSIEVADLLQDYADYMVASQETEPGFGWNYDFLSQLKQPGMDGAHMGKAIIDSYMEYYDQLFEAYPSSSADLTLSCLDLRKMDQMEQSINDLFSVVDDTLDTDGFMVMAQDRYQVKSFGRFSTDFDYDLIDLNHMLTLMQDDYPEAEQAVAALDDLVLYRRTNVANAGGISIYYPCNNMLYATQWVNDFAETGFASAYAQFMTGLLDWQEKPGLFDSLDLQKAAVSSHVQENGDHVITMQLTPEQMNSYAKSTYFIFKKVTEDDGSESYLVLYRGADVTVTDDGLLSANYADKALYVKENSSGEISMDPITMLECDVSADGIRYTAPVVLLGGFEDGSDFKTCSANLQIVIDPTTGEGTVLSAVPLNQEESADGLAEKQLLDLTDYSLIEFLGSMFTPERNADGTLSPISEWETTGRVMGWECDLSEGFSLQVQDLDPEGDYYCMFSVTDVQGNVTSSAFIPLANSAE